MNSLAEFSPPTVKQIQKDIDSALKLEDAALGAAGSIDGAGLQEYKGPRFLRPEADYNDAQMSQADVVKYDTSLLTEEFKLSGSGSISGSQGNQYRMLVSRICYAIGDCCGGTLPGGGGTSQYGNGIIPLYRS